MYPSRKRHPIASVSARKEQNMITKVCFYQINVVFMTIN